MEKNNRFLPGWKDFGNWQQLCRKLKYVLVFMLILVWGVRAEVYSQQYVINLQLQQTPLAEIFSRMESQTGLKFLYNTALIESKGRVDVKARNADVRLVLDELLRPLGLTYVLERDQIVVKKAVPAVPQEEVKTKTITGKITDEQGNVLPGVTIVIKGTMWGTASGIDGKYKLEIPANADQVLVFSFVGMKTQEITVGSKNEINVKMVSDTETLDDVVVTGIFSKAKESYTGAVTTISDKELKMFKGQNLLLTLQNIDPSINIPEDNFSGSNPNRIPEINIRGGSSLPIDMKALNDNVSKQLNMPLVIQDGFEISITKLMDFNDEEIKSITILKDASATAIYGSRGANGVIVITTKAPQAGKLKIYVQGGLNIEVPDLSSYNLLNAKDKLELERIVGIYEDKEDFERDRSLKEMYNALYKEVLKGVNTDWLSQPLRTGVGQRYSLRLEGGNESFRWGTSLSYNSTVGVMKGSERNTFNGSITLNYSLGKVLFRNYTNIGMNKSSESKYGYFSDYADMNPYYRIRDEKGNIIKEYNIKGYRISNPLYDAQLNIVNENRYTSLQNNFSIEWKVNDDLRLQGQIGLQKQQNTSDNYLPSNHTSFSNYDDGDSYFRKGNYTYGTGEDVSIDVNATLNYSKLFHDKHQVYVGLYYTIAQNKSYNYQFMMEGFPDSKLDFLGNALRYQKDGKPYGTENLSRRVGVTGNMNYSYDNRYFMDLSFRADGSSLFGAKNKFAPFWSVGVGWNMHNEKFMENQHVVSLFRIRGSYGETGSQQFSPYQALSTFQSYSDKRYIIWNGAQLMGLGNERLKWQLTKQVNGGIEVDLWNRRLSASVDVYRGKTYNLLSQMDLPHANGFNSYVDNVGELENTGFEAMLSGYLIQNTLRDITWSVTAKLAHNKEKVTKLSEAIKQQNDRYKNSGVEVISLLYEGYSTNSIWAVPSLGVDPSTGKEIYLDQNGKITETWNTWDKRYYGVSQPKYKGNISTYFAWKNLSVNLSFYYQWGGQQYNFTLLDKVEVSNGVIERYNVDKRVYEKRWQKPGDVKPFKGYGNERTKFTSRFVMDDNVFKFQNISVDYRLHSDYISNRWGIQYINIGANMSDIFYISSIKRERGTNYPYSRYLSLNVSLMF